ncbi:hypothetical protein VQ056_31080 [Paenibacillus sp. JTLBN-2024]
MAFLGLGSYGEALTALDYKLIVGKGKVIPHEKLEAERAGRSRRRTCRSNRF